MKFNLSESINLLKRTPEVLRTLLKDLPENWTHSDEGEDTWSPFTVMGHLVHGERTDWIPRIKVTLGNDISSSFVPFDRFAQFEESKGKNMDQLLDEFVNAREENLRTLQSFDISNEKLEYVATHPSLGRVELRHLLSAWVVHDLGHIGQISRVMAKQYFHEVGPWTQYMAILHDRKEPSGL